MLVDTLVVSASFQISSHFVLTQDWSKLFHTSSLFQCFAPTDIGRRNFFSYYLMPRTGFEPESVELHPERKTSILDALSEGVLNLLFLGFFLFFFFLLLAQSGHLFLRTCFLPLTPKDAMARILLLTPAPQPGIKLTSVQLHLSDGPLLRALY